MYAYKLTIMTGTDCNDGKANFNDMQLFFEF